MDIGSAWENKGYQEVTRPPEEGGARKVDKEVGEARQVGPENAEPGWAGPNSRESQTLSCHL